jgi:hypothetical protein
MNIARMPRHSDPVRARYSKLTRGAVADIAFTTRLTEADWDETLRGWRCPPLAVPGAVIEALYVDGDRVDTAKYEVLAQHALIRWAPPDQPQRTVAAVKLTEELTLGKETDRWKKLAIVLPVIATILSAAIAATATYFSRAAPVGASSSQRSTQSASLVPQMDSTPACSKTVECATQLELGQAAAATATSEPRWFKFAIDRQGPATVGVLIRNPEGRGRLRATLYDSNERELKVDGFWTRNLFLEASSERPTSYFVMVKGELGSAVHYEILATTQAN